MAPQKHCMARIAEATRFARSEAVDLVHRGYSVREIAEQLGLDYKRTSGLIEGAKENGLIDPKKTAAGRVARRDDRSRAMTMQRRRTPALRELEEAQSAEWFAGADIREKLNWLNQHRNRLESIGRLLKDLPNGQVRDELTVAQPIHEKAVVDWKAAHEAAEAALVKAQERAAAAKLALERIEAEAGNPPAHKKKKPKARPGKAA